VQAFLPSPMASATAMYHTGWSPLRSLKRPAPVAVPRDREQRRLHKALLRYHDPENWPLIREALRRMGRADLIGPGKACLVPTWQPANTGKRGEGRRRPSGAGPPAPLRSGGAASDAGPPRASRSEKKKVRRGTALTQHTGLPPGPKPPRPR
jgi:hypothetical protein